MKHEERKLFSRIGIDFSPLESIGASYESVIEYTRDKILGALNHIESNKKTYSPMDEEGLSRVICGILNGNGVLVAVPEQFTNGRVDITVTAPTIIPTHSFTYLGEAKIWKGNEYAVGGFEQLRTYATGRHLHASLLFYFKNKTIDKKFRDFIDHLIKRDAGSVESLKQRFAVTEHLHPTNQKIKIDHYALHLDE